VGASEGELFYGFESDENDVWLITHQLSACTLDVFVWDDSAGSWSSATTASITDTCTAEVGGPIPIPWLTDTVWSPILDSDDFRVVQLVGAGGSLTTTELTSVFTCDTQISTLSTQLVAVAGEKAVYAIWGQIDAAPQRIKFSKTTDDGATWGTAGFLSDNFTGHIDVSVAKVVQRTTGGKIAPLFNFNNTVATNFCLAVTVDKVTSPKAYTENVVKLTAGGVL